MRSVDDDDACHIVDRWLKLKLKSIVYGSSTIMSTLRKQGWYDWSSINKAAEADTEATVRKLIRKQQYD